jgi:cation diffusion facilitator CzcD-associated flavoprotein CzcO
MNKANTNTTNNNNNKKVAIIGGGLSGLFAAATLQADGHECIIFEATSVVGGIWRHDAYPGARLQNVRWEYHYPDLDWPLHLATEDYPTKE